MTGLNAEERDKFFEDCGNYFQDNTKFLVDRGWIKTEKDEINGEKIFSVWTHPVTGEEYGHQTHLLGHDAPSAVGKAENDLLEEQGWVSFGMESHYPQLDEDFKKQSDEDGKEWGCYIHPESRNVYSYLEVIDIVRYGESESEVGLCGKTEEIQKILKEQNIEPQENMLLHLNFSIPEGEDTNTHSFKSVEYRNE